MKTNRILGLGAVCALSISAGLACNLVIGLHPADTGPACTNADDQKALGQHGGTFVGDLVGCTLANMADQNAAIVCIEGKDEVSPACATCAAASGGCGALNCSASCMQGSDSAECEGCIAMACSAAFQACAGFPIDACLDPQDTMATAQHTDILMTDAQSCGAQHPEDPTATIACIQQKDGLSQPCATCYEQEILCSLTQCSVCVTDPTSATCTSCFDMYCSPVFALCSGFASLADGGPG